MSETPLIYERVERQLASADIEISGAEVHGVLCGLLCAGRKSAHAIWFRELFSETESEEPLIRECRDSLDRMYQQTFAAIDGPGLGFTPFLAEDDKPLKVRAGAVSDWCRGFLYGVGLAGISPEKQLSAETQEALHDFTEISRMDTDALGDSEEDEEALIEITEFPWVAAMLVHADAVPDMTERS